MTTPILPVSLAEGAHPEVGTPTVDLLKDLQLLDEREAKLWSTPFNQQAITAGVTAITKVGGIAGVFGALGASIASFAKAASYNAASSGQMMVLWACGTVLLAVAIIAGALLIRADLAARATATAAQYQARANAAASYLQAREQTLLLRTPGHNGRGRTPKGKS